MAEDLSMALAELLRKAQLERAADFLREGGRTLSQALMEPEVTQHPGAGRYERGPERTGQRNGYRERQWDTRVGSIGLRVPRVRDGSFFPSLLEPRKRAEQALVAAVEAYVHGVSTRRVDDLVQALGMQGISKSQVSRLCQELDEEVGRFRARKLDGTYPYIWLDATYLKVREQGRVVSQAVVLAVGVRQTGERAGPQANPVRLGAQREVLGLDVGPSEDGAFWTAFLRGLTARGLAGVQLVTSDAHEGLKGAIAAVLQGAIWQRRRVHFVRNALALVPKSAAAMVAATIRTAFAQPDPKGAREHQRKVVGPPPGRDAGYNHFCLVVDDLAAALQRLAGRGLPIPGGPTEGLDYNLQYWIADPDGNRIELMQISPRSPHAAADASWRTPAPT